MLERSVSQNGQSHKEKPPTDADVLPVRDLSFACKTCGGSVLARVACFNMHALCPHCRTNMRLDHAASASLSHGTAKWVETVLFTCNVRLGGCGKNMVIGADLIGLDAFCPHCNHPWLMILAK